MRNRPTAILACDMVVRASNESPHTARRGRTRIAANTHEIHTASFVHTPDADLHWNVLLEKRFAAGPDRVTTCDAQMLAERLLGDIIGANLVMMGFAFQQGRCPVSSEALLQAIELNGVAIDMNTSAFAIGRLAAANPEALAKLVGAPAKKPAQDESSVAAWMR